jgi:hypothetical protein
MAGERVVPTEHGEKLASALGTCIWEKIAVCLLSYIFIIIIMVIFSFGLGLEFFETSAKENVNVKVVFER